MNRSPIDSRTEDAAAERWRLADKAAAAQARRRDGIAALAEATGRPSATLRRWARVARQFPPSTRRPGLSFSHHEVLVGLPDRFRLAERAELQRWTVARTKAQAILAHQGGTPGTPPPPGGLMRRGPEALDAAISYLTALRRAGGQFGEPVRARAQKLAALAQAVASSAPAGRRLK
jgi:hypothetical protein